MVFILRLCILNQNSENTRKCPSQFICIIKKFQLWANFVMTKNIFAQFLSEMMLKKLRACLWQIEDNLMVGKCKIEDWKEKCIRLSVKVDPQLKCFCDPNKISRETFSAPGDVKFRFGGHCRKMDKSITNTTNKKYCRCLYGTHIGKYSHYTDLEKH